MACEFLWDAALFMWWTCGINCICTSPAHKQQEIQNLL